MNKYVVNFSTAEGTTGRYDGYTNLGKARKDARAMAKGNCLIGSHASWAVSTTDGERIAEGRI